jgi:hypothetical protein
LSNAVGAGFALWGLLIGLAPLGDNSLFTHIATGRLILRDGFPHSDPYSFTASGEPWVVQSWLPSLLYAAVERIGGLLGLRMLGGLVAASLALLVWILTRPSRTLLPRIAVSATVMVIASAVWSPRPLLFGLLFFGFTMLVLERHLHPALLLPVFVLWVNSHGSFAFGLLLLVLVGIGCRLDGAATGGVRRALAWAAGGTALGVLNPYGLELLLFPTRALERQAALREILEWQAPSFQSAWTRAFMALLALAVIALCRRPSWRAAVPLVVFGLAALIASRNIAFAALAMVPGCARGLASLGSLTGAKANGPARVVWAATLALTGVVTVVGVQGPDLELHAYPVTAVAWWERGANAGGRNLVTQDVVGNYRELILGPGAKVWIDDRFDMFPGRLVADHRVLLHAGPGWERVLDRWAVDAVLWERATPLGSVLAEHSSWRIAYADERWMIVERLVQGPASDRGDAGSS